MITPDDFTRIKLDTYGNPRYVCHYVHFIKESDGFTSLDGQYALARNRAKKLGGGKFHNKQYGGGIVFQSYNIQNECDRINALMASL